MEITELTEMSERREAVPILRQLWTQFDPEEVEEWTADDDYHLFGGYVDGELVGVAGVLVRHHLHHVRHAWLYDLVVDEPERGHGFGTELVQFVEEWAGDRDCEYVALASPVSKGDVHEFYEDLDYERSMYVVEKEL